MRSHDENWKSAIDKLQQRTAQDKNQSNRIKAATNSHEVGSIRIARHQWVSELLRIWRLMRVYWVSFYCAELERKNNRMGISLVFSRQRNMMASLQLHCYHRLIQVFWDWTQFRRDLAGVGSVWWRGKPVEAASHAVFQSRRLKWMSETR